MLYSGCGLLLTHVAVMASSNPAEQKGASERIKRVQVDVLMSQLAYGTRV